jgi:hypothetical protein
MLGTGIARAIASGREGAEELWADAQSIKRRGATTEPDGSARTGLAQQTDVGRERSAQADVENAVRTAATPAARPREWPRTYGRTTTSFGRSGSTTFDR